MREVAETGLRWRADGHRVALATVVATWGSSPRPVGSTLAVSDRGDVVGSVSGGCVESAVAEEATRLFEGGPARLLGYGVDDETAWSVGLTCGGRIQVFLEPWDDDVDGVARAVADDRGLASAIVLDGDAIGRRLVVGLDGARTGGLSGGLDDEAARRLEPLLTSFGTERVALEGDGGPVDAFLQGHAPRPKLVVVGAVHVARPLVAMAHAAGFHVTVVDPREALASRQRFPHADAVVAAWPEEALAELPLDENTFVVLLVHRLDVEIPALRRVLERPVRYVGALGSRRTHERRLRALREAGVDDEVAGRIHAPIGLDLGGRRAEEIAVAVLAEMVQVRNR